MASLALGKSGGGAGPSGSAPSPDYGNRVWYREAKEVATTALVAAAASGAAAAGAFDEGGGGREI